MENLFAALWNSSEENEFLHEEKEDDNDDYNVFTRLIKLLIKSKRNEKMRLEFSSHFSVFGNWMKHSSSYLKCYSTRETL